MKSEKRAAGNILNINNNLNKDSTKSSFESAQAGLKRYESSTLNGILKNGTTKVNGNSNGHPKNISFGEVKQ